jgi:hypothetical protein
LPPCIGGTRTIALGLPSSCQRGQIAATSESKYDAGGASSPVNWAAVTLSPGWPSATISLSRCIGRKTLGHVLGQGAAVGAHAVELHRTAVAAVRGRREEEESAAALAPERDDLREAVGGGVVGFVDKHRLALEVGREIVGGEAVQGGVGAGEPVVERAGLAEVLDNALHRADLAVARSEDRVFRHLNGRDGDAATLGEGDDFVIAFDEALLDLLLGRGNDRVGKALSQVHGHQRDDLYCFARAGGLFNEDVAGGTANIVHQFFLILP